MLKKVMLASLLAMCLVVGAFANDEPLDDGTLDNELLDDGELGNELPGDETLGNELPDDGTLGNELPDDGTLGDGLSGDEALDDGLSGDGTLDDGAPDNGPFSDVPADFWCANEIVQAVNAGIVSGYEDGTFKPQNNVTYAHLSAFLARAFYADEYSESEADAWYSPYTGILSEKGVLKDTNLENEFSDYINQPVNRYEMAQMFYNVLYQKTSVSISPDDIQTTFQSITDGSSVPEHYQSAVATCYSQSIINGYEDGAFGGDALMTRGSGCVLISRLQKYLEQQTARKLAAEVITLVNQERANVGLEPLGTFDSLTQAAEIRVAETLTEFSHDRPDGSSCFTVLDETGASNGAYTMGENISAGSNTAEGVMEQWMNSEGHKDNILNKDYTHIGVAYVKSDSGYGHYWVQIFVGISGQQDEESTSETGTTEKTAQELAAEVIALVNQERANVGLKPLGTLDSLTQAAEIRVTETLTEFSHDRPDGSSCFTVLDETGVSNGAYKMGENIAAGSNTASGVMEQWMNSEGHKDNILNKDYTHIGVAYVKSDSGYGHYWVQMFVGISGQQDEESTSDANTTENTAQKLAAEVVALVNQERAKAGLKPLGTFDSLTQAAETRAAETVTTFSHDRPDGSTCFTALDETGASSGAYTMGENIAAGSDTAEGVMEQWMNSEGHKDNILNKDYTHIGVAYVKSDSGYVHYWVQMFIGRND